MKSIEESITYTTDKKSYQLSKLLISHYQEPLGDLGRYLINDKKRGSVALNLGYLSTWYHWQFIYNFTHSHQISYNSLALSTYYALECNNWEYFLGKAVETYCDATALPDSMNHLAQMLYLGWEDKAILYGNFLVKMLYGKQYDGWVKIPVHPWFMLELFCRWQKIELNRRKLHYPDSLGIYENALSNWDTQDTGLLSIIIDKLSAFHIHQSDEYEHPEPDGGNCDGYHMEFSYSNYFIFPAEILFWLAIRRRLGLPGYQASAQNDLMNLEINQLPSSAFPYPRNDLVEQCKRKLMEDNSGVTFEL